MNNKTEFIDLVRFGIDLIGKNISADEIKKLFTADYTPHSYDWDPITNLVLNHKYLGQESFSLCCDQDAYQIILDFDLVPMKSQLAEHSVEKNLTNFKIKISAKNHSSFPFFEAPLESKYKEVRTFLNQEYSKDKILTRPDLITTDEIESVEAQIKAAYDSYTPRPKEILINYIARESSVYLSVFYHFNGNEETSPFLSFSVSDPTI